MFCVTPILLPSASLLSQALFATPPSRRAPLREELSFGTLTLVYANCSAEPGTYARRMREITARHSSDSESETPQSRGHADTRRRERPSRESDSLSKWRGERTRDKQRGESSEKVAKSWRSVSPTSEDESRTAMAVSTSTAERTHNIVHGRRDPISASQRHGDRKDCPPVNGYDEPQRTPRSSTSSIVSIAAEPSPKTPPRSPVARSSSGTFDSPTAVGSLDGGRAVSRPPAVSPRSPNVGRVSPRLSAVERVHLSEAMDAVVEKMLFSLLGEHVMDGMFLAVSVQSTDEEKCSSTSCLCTENGGGGRGRVHWQRDEDDDELNEEADRHETRGGEKEHDREKPFHFREVDFARWDSREDESRYKREQLEREQLSGWRSSDSPDLSPTGKFDKTPGKFEKTHISIQAGDELAAVRDSPWNKTGKSDEMPRWSQTVWSDNLSKTPGGGNVSFSHTRCTHNTSISENIDASPSHTRTRRTEHNVSITEVINSSLMEDPANSSVISEEGGNAHIYTPRGKGENAAGGRRAVHRRGKSMDEDFCILEDLDMADCETGEVFVDRG